MVPLLTARTFNMSPETSKRNTNYRFRRAQRLKSIPRYVPQHLWLAQHPAAAYSAVSLTLGTDVPNSGVLTLVDRILPYDTYVENLSFNKYETIVKQKQYSLDVRKIFRFTRWLIC